MPRLEEEPQSTPFICEEPPKIEEQKESVRRVKRTIEISNTMAVYRKSQVEKGDRF